MDGLPTTSSPVRRVKPERSSASARLVDLSGDNNKIGASLGEGGTAGGPPLTGVIPQGADSTRGDPGRLGGALSSAFETPEGEDRVQLDRVRSDPGLAVGEVEEGDPGNARSSAEPDMVPCYAHLLAPKRRRVPVAARRRRLGDHVIAARLKNNVEVGVAFGRTSTTAAMTVKT